MKTMIKAILAGMLITGAAKAQQFQWDEHPAGYKSPSAAEAHLKAPDSGHVQILTTVDGSVNIGRIVGIRSEEIEFETSLAKMVIPVSQVKKIEEVPLSTMKGGKYWFPNPNISRLYFAPTAHMLKQGQGYFSDYYIFFPGFAYGITDNVSIGGGMSLFPGIDFDEQLFFITPKIGLRTSSISNLAVGALVVALPGDAPTLGIIYGVGTFGAPDGSLTAGLGYGFADGNLADKPAIMVGGEKRLSRRISFVSENYIVPGVDQPLISYGIRFFGEKISVDLGLFNTVGEDMIFPGLPWVDFVIGF